MSSAAHTVNVANLSAETSEKELNEFFSFCGKITSVDYHAAQHTAAIHFEKSSAAKTALMLNGGTLGSSQISVTSDVDHQDTPAEAHTDAEQSDKPRAGIAAEYLARGYVLSDQVLQRAIEIDNKNGISSRFLNYFNNIDKAAGSRALGPEQTISAKVQETVQSGITQAKATDEQRGISKTFFDYITRALSTPFGKRVETFYTSTSKQVLDIHEEAKRIAEAQKTSLGTAAPTPSASATTTL